MPLPIPDLHLSTSSTATGGVFDAASTQGDFVVSWAGDARVDRTAPAAGSLAGAIGGGSLLLPGLLAALIVGAALLWKRSK